jgi:DNA-binding MarR family transcriptional regulator
MCDRLIKKGLIMRRNDTSDRRLIRLTLAERGRDLVDEVTRRRRKEIVELVRAVPEDQRVAMVDALRRLAAAAGEVPEQDWSAGWGLEIGRPSR